MNRILFRPVGLHELALVWDAGMREFPPRLPHQAIFYPVANIEYARQIARDWNTGDEKSGFSGFVTAFELDNSHLSKLEPHTVGSSKHLEYWIPAEDLSAFNAAIRGFIRLEEGYFGAAYTGHVPDALRLKGEDAIAQFVALSKALECGTFDATCEIPANRKNIFLNWLFWSQHDFSKVGISQDQREILLSNLKRCWKINQIDVPLPRPMDD
jgi:hypothetical protein